MTRQRFLVVARAWLGVAALVVALLALVVMAAEFAWAWHVTPAEKAFVDTLRTKAKTDAEVQKILKPEWDRQHGVLVRRRLVYRIGGVSLAISVAVFFAWMRWMRPRAGEWEGVPPFVVSLLGGPADQQAPPVLPTRQMMPAGGMAGPGPGLRLPAAGVAAPSETVNVADIDAIVRGAGTSRDAVLPILQAIQARYRYLPHPALARVCETTAISPAQVSGVASFFGQFRLTPTGRHIIRVCEGTACHVAGAVEVRTEIRRLLGVPDHSDTDPTRTFTIERVACVGSCSLAPVITIDEGIYGHLTALSVAQVLNDFIEADAAAAGSPMVRPAGGDRLSRPRPAQGAAPPIEIRVGLGTCGRASGAVPVHHAVEEAVALLGGGAAIKAVGCNGLCHHEPLVEVVAGDRRTLYGNLAPADVRAIVRQHVRPAGVVRAVREGARDLRARLVDDRAWTPASAHEVSPGPYLGRQVRVVLENCGHIAPLSADEYRERGGMRGLETCLSTLSPEAVIEQVHASGLRGRGGAGFPTGTKWALTRRASGTRKFVICNGDEGDPGAFMDRAVLESDPFRVIEGLAIAAYAVGAAEGIVYVRSEYPIAVKHAREAIAIATARGWLGRDIFGSGFSVSLEVREGAGAFVCGEETALIQSIEGDRGMPRLRPPYPAEAGLWGCPTLINNVETLACLPWIFRNGPDAFAAMGTATSKGTKVFSLTGKVRRTGLIEVPMGMTIREVVEDIGGGVPEGRRFKAVLAGGPSGGCIPASLADTPIDFEALASTGAIMGSGGLVVLDDRDCAVEIARYFLQFTQNESCGKCTYCRVGTKRMLEILERICEGRGREGDLQALEDLGTQIKAGSLCGLGQTAPNPVLTTLRYFREEYEAHIRDSRCPAAFCKPLVHYRVLDHCTGCTLCAQACPAGAIDVRPYRRHEVFDDKCTRCGMCVTACPEDAVEVA